jgi:Domain of unknown function (DUF4416)
MIGYKSNSFICCISPAIGSSDYCDLIDEIDSDLYPIGEILPTVSWNAPIQYKKEMGEELKTEIIIIDRLCDLDKLVFMKKYTMFLEYLTSHSDRRTFNLNPGYVNEEGMFLLTHKDNTIRGRQLIKDGIWKEKQFSMSNGCLIRTYNTFSEYFDKMRIRTLTNLAKPVGASVVGSVSGMSHLHLFRLKSHCAQHFRQLGPAPPRCRTPTRCGKSRTRHPEIPRPLEH